MARKTWKDRLLDKMYEDQSSGAFWDNVTTPYSHFDTQHNAKSDSELINRLIEKGHSVSSFANEHDMKSCIEDAVVNNFGLIMQNLDKLHEYDKLALRFDYDDELYEDVDFGTHQKGFIRNRDGNIMEMDTPSVCAVIQKDSKSEYGFSVLTAYPDMESDLSVPTGRDINDLVKSSQAYQKATPLKKAYLDHACDLNTKFALRYTENMGTNPEVITMFVPTSNPNVKHRIFMDQIDTKIRTFAYRDDKWMKTDSEFTNANMDIYRTKQYSADLTKPIIRGMLAQNYPDAHTELQTVQANFVKHRQEQIDRRRNYQSPVIETEVENTGYEF